MLRTEEVRDFLEKSGKPVAFDNIWKNVKSEVIESLAVDHDEDRIKADLYLSLMEDSRLIMVGDNTWDLKERYSLSNQGKIEKARMTEEIELVWEESDETKELNLKIVRHDEED